MKRSTSASGQGLSGNVVPAGRHDDAYDVPFTEVEPQNRFADANSWGYRLAVRADYLNALGAWNVSPRSLMSFQRPAPPNCV